jgi:hypothetical protein
MRVFDIVGVLAVSLWVGVIGLYAVDHWKRSATQDFVFGEMLISEGETWLTMQREDEEVGYVHEVRTRLPDGWLFEYKMVLVVEVMTFQQLIETQIKSTMNSDGVLRQFSADVTAMNQTFRAQGVASDERLEFTLLAGNLSPIQRTIDLAQPPRLAVNAINQFLASPDLKPGARLRQPFFDPSTMQMTTMEYEYIGPEETEVLEVKYASHRFHQHVAGTSVPLETIVDERGEVLIQTFPMRTIAYRISPELARVQVASWNRRLREAGRSGGSQPGPRDGETLSIDAALDLLGNLRLPSLAPAADGSEDEDEDEALPTNDPTPIAETETP